MSSSLANCLQFGIFVLLLYLEGSKSQKQVPCNQTQNNTFRNFYYYYTSWPPKICSWKFESPQNSTDYAVLVTLLYLWKSGSSSKMVLPDGSIMTNINVDYDESAICILYTSPYSNCSHFGKHNCGIKKSKDWPPRINVTSNNIWIRLTYLIIDCPSDVTTTHALTTTFVSTSTSTLITTTEITSDVTETTPSIVQSDQLSSIRKLENTNNILLGFVIGFGVLLLLVSVVYFVKFKRLKNTFDSKPLQNNAVNDDGNAVYEFANAPPSGHAEMVNNELYQSHGGGL
uniref:uncharacterized protein LOC101242234 isoform X3 n=1 Tax=Ciona intestinalis TaxID=7719 RepID=UPI000EF5306B|nr:uncharacterized protein LOC101242234 isoform X3 [Ciona intestinalis]|eukprot:XP_026693056.1 uncharacterized protein LOC101242234 isoform X3 [Ciona intestinalis]